MKKKQAQRLLDQTILEFGDTLADILFEAQVLVHMFKTIRAGETISRDKKTGLYTRTSIGEWFQAISVDDLSSHKPVHFILGGKYGNKESVLKRFPNTLNAEFRWLLVSGYEAYERFLRQLYAVSGYCDRNLWRCADFGNDKSINQTAAMSLTDFKNRVKPPSELHPAKIRTRLTHRFGKIQSVESGTLVSFGTETITFAEYIRLIELMRHVIVHEQSMVVPGDFFARLQKEWKYKNTIDPKLKTQILKHFFNRSKTSWNIWLVAHSASPAYDIHARPLGKLLQGLGSHACLQYGEVARHFGHTPFWKRQA